MKLMLPVLWGVLWLSVGVGWAKPSAPSIFCDEFSDTPMCSSGTVACDLCHTAAPARNLYGESLALHLLITIPLPHSEEDFVSGLPEALDATSEFDADNDGFSNLEEIVAGSHPARADSVPAQGGCDDESLQWARAPENVWNVCEYDPVYAFKKVYLDFCGRSASFVEVETLRAAEDGWRDVMTAALTGCMQTDFWQGKEGVVWNLANDKIRPAASIKSGEDGGPIPLGDYYDDYNLFVYTHTGDRDVRESLTAEYFVEREENDDEPDTFTRFTRPPLLDFNVRGFDEAQLAEIDTRAGLLTSRWFLVNFTMFTSIPRTTAAQAYRAYLGFDISKMQGLTPVDEPLIDYDNKGVTEPECAICHTTLDPLTYPFSRYDGLGGGLGAFLGDPTGAMQAPESFVGPDGRLNLTFASYTADRLSRFPIVDGELVAETPEAGVLLGQPVSNLREWAQVAANSEPFAQNIVRDYWQLLIGREPAPEEFTIFETLWKDLMGDNNYRVEAMLQALVLSEAYGVP